jgi:Ca-activated chloride channel homolog
MPRSARPVVIISMLSAATLAASAQQATFSSRLEAVRVDVSVTRDGTPVKGLAAGDFEILDNGVRQEVQLVSSEDIPIDLVLALDMSGSVTGERIAHLRNASQMALKGLTKNDRCALLTFSHRLTLRVPLTSDVAAIAKALDGDFEPGNTSMIDAAYAALAHADSGRGRGLAIVLSDGVDTSSWLPAESVMETARRVDAVLFGVSTDAPKQTPLSDLADASGGDLIRIESTKQLTATLTSLLEAFRQRYLLSFVPQNVARAGWHKLEVRTKRRGLTVKARTGYFGS